MTSFKRFDDKVWDRFFDFIYSEELSQEEVHHRLKVEGIDLTQASQRIKQALKERTNDTIIK